MCVCMYVVGYATKWHQWVDRFGPFHDTTEERIRCFRSKGGEEANVGKEEDSDPCLVNLIQVYCFLFVLSKVSANHRFGVIAQLVCFGRSGKQRIRHPFQH